LTVTKLKLISILLASLLAAVALAFIHTGCPAPLVLPSRGDETIRRARWRDIGWSGLLLLLFLLVGSAVFATAAVSSAPAGFLVMVVLAPLVETLLLQGLPDWALAKLPVTTRKAALMLLFATAHVLMSAGGWVVGLGAGVWLTLVFYGQLPYGRSFSLLVSTGVHVVLNGCCWLLQFIL